MGSETNPGPLGAGEWNNVARDVQKICEAFADFETEQTSTSTQKFKICRLRIETYGWRMLSSDSIVRFNTEGTRHRLLRMPLTIERTKVRNLRMYSTGTALHANFTRHKRSSVPQPGANRNHARAHAGRLSLPFFLTSATNGGLELPACRNKQQCFCSGLSV